MNYSKKMLINKNESSNLIKEKIKLIEEKKKNFIHYYKKINEINSLLQEYKLNLFEIKKENIEEECKNKSNNLIKEVETNFFNFYNLLKDEIKDKNDNTMGVNLIMINLK
jgi:hypothetical protein